MSGSFRIPTTDTRIICYDKIWPIYVLDPSVQSKMHVHARLAFTRNQYEFTVHAGRMHPEFEHIETFFWDPIRICIEEIHRPMVMCEDVVRREFRYHFKSMLDMAMPIRKDTRQKRLSVNFYHFQWEDEGLAWICWHLTEMFVADASVRFWGC